MKYLFYWSLLLLSYKTQSMCLLPDINFKEMMKKQNIMPPIMRSKSISEITHLLKKDHHSHFSKLPNDIHSLLNKYYCFIEEQERNEYLRLDEIAIFLVRQSLQTLKIGKQS